MRLAQRLVTVLGRRAFWSFGLVTFLMAGLLATVSLASRHALRVYVGSQLERTPWDMAVYESGSANPGDRTPADRMRRVAGITQVETLAILRAKLPEQGSVTLIDGKPLYAPWLTVIAATDPSLLPPKLHLALQNAASGGRSQAPFMALIGPEQSMGRAFLALQGAREFDLRLKVGGKERSLFTVPLSGVIRLEREELTRWTMEQMGAAAYVPHISVVLIMPYDDAMLTRFDSLARGMIPADMMVAGADPHVQRAEYAPEVIHLARIDRPRLISGWDIPASRQRVAELCDRLQRVVSQPEQARADPQPRIVLAAFQGHTHAESEPGETEEVMGTSGYIVDSTTRVLLERMERTARLIGLIALLVALPLLWMGWMLAANLSALLMLNERRTFGLMRLRGVPGKDLGRAMLVAITAGGAVGGLLGLITGSVLPLLVYEHGRLPLDVLVQRSQLLQHGLFLVITVVLALLVSWRLITYATTISPLEASRRVASSESGSAGVTFGPLQLLALAVGVFVLSGWVFGFSLASWAPFARLRDVVSLLDFLGLPLFIYGAASLLASRRTWIQRLMGPLLKLLGGRLGLLAQRHMIAKPHRSVAFLLIVSLMASVSLYPTLASRSFEDKAARGAQVQVGSDWHFTFNSPDLVGVEQLKGELRPQLVALGPALEAMRSAAAGVQGVESVTYIAEALLPDFYLPGFGLRGVPLYLLNDTDAYLRDVYSEPELGVQDRFDRILSRVKTGGVAVSPHIADFWELSQGSPLRLGVDDQFQALSASTAGTLAYLPGMPPRSVTDRQGYVQARVDYLNYLFDNNAYIVAAADNPAIARLQVLIPRVILLVRVNGIIPPDPEESARLQSALVRAFPTAPLEVHTLTEEVQKVGSDMFVSLALENMRIYLIGGLLLALIAILSVALANYTEDRRTLALLRIRGASPAHIRRFLIAMLMSPALLGLVLGGATALIAGYGLTNYVWELREIRSIVHLLWTHLIVSRMTVATTALLLFLIVAVAWAFSVWMFRSSARENVAEV